MYWIRTSSDFVICTSSFSNANSLKLLNIGIMLKNSIWILHYEICIKFLEGESMRP
jgi:hypothetical protein